MPSTAPDPCPRYRPRPPTNPLKEIVEDHVEEMLEVYDERFFSTYGPLHPRVRELFESFTRCGDLHFGFLRMRCPDCGHEKLLPVSSIVIALKKSWPLSELRAETRHCLGRAHGHGSIEKPIPALIVAPQSFGSLLNPHAHLHDCVFR